MFKIQEYLQSLRVKKKSFTFGCQNVVWLIFAIQMLIVARFLLREVLVLMCVCIILFHLSHEMLQKVKETL